MEGASPVRTKTMALKHIGTYLSKTKRWAKLICEYMYGMRGKDNAVAKRDRLIETVDLLEKFKYFRVVPADETDEICGSATRRVICSFGAIDNHYTYTLRNSNVENDIEEDDNEVDELVDGTDVVEQDVDDDSPRFLSVT